MYDYMSLEIGYLSKSSIEQVEGIELVKEGHKYGQPFAIYRWHNFTINYSKAKTITGSIHHLYNILEGHGSHNCNDLDFHSFLETMYYLMATFNLKRHTRIRVLEYGFNLITSFCPKRMLRSHLVGWNKEIGSSKDYSSRGHQLHIRAANDRLIKLYDKGKHQRECARGKNVFRFEIRYEANRAIQQAMKLPRGYEVTIKDVLSIEGIRMLNTRTLEAAKQLMIVDSIEPQMSAKDLNKFRVYLTELYWSGLLEKVNYPKRSRHFQDFHKLVKRYKIDTLKNEIIQGLQLKFVDLQKCKKSHYEEKGISARNPTIDITGISITPSLKPSKAVYLNEQHPDHPDNKKKRNRESNKRNNLLRAKRRIESEHEYSLLASLPIDDILCLDAKQIGGDKRL